jgi:hypothetical protein
MARMPSPDARRWIRVYERLVDRAAVLVLARSNQDQAILRNHADRLRERLAFWKAWR